MTKVTIKDLVPDFKRNTTQLMSVLIAQVCALIIALLTFEGSFFVELGLVSTYCLWFTIVFASGLVASSALIKLPSSFFLAQSVIFAVFLIAFLITESAAQFFYSTTSKKAWDWDRFFKHLAIAIILNFVLVRLFVLNAVMQSRSRSQSEIKLLALQSRIQPHFLFNSLNAIGELVHVDSALAEEAIQSLASLFRASLQGRDNIHSLKDELKLCDSYIELESLRFGDKLNISINQSVQRPDLWQCPKLLIQPIIENVVTHGTQDDGSVIAELDLRETEKYLSIKVSNLVPKTSKKTRGNGIAIKSIKETLFVLYDDDFNFSSKANGDRYEVIVRMPKMQHQANKRG